MSDLSEQFADLAPSTEHMDQLYEEYLAALLAPDRTEAFRVLRFNAETYGVTVEQCYLDVIARAQHEIGRLWQRNEVTVAQEHIATAISQLTLAQFYPMLPRDPRNGRHIVVACVEGEHHELGARMVADFCEMAGFDVTYAGVNVPTDSLVQLIVDLTPHAVVLSVTMTFNLPALHAAIIAIRSVAGPTLPIIVGGQALNCQDTLPEDVEAFFEVGDARAAVAQLYGRGLAGCP